MQVAESPFGSLLKEWRGQRRMSQLDLGLAANVSAPRTARNQLLNAAGFSPAYRTRDLDAGEMSHVRAAVDWTLERHDPFPAFALDRHWHLVAANQSAGQLIGGLGLQAGDSLLEALTTSEALRAAIDNWAEVARYVAVRLRTESAHLGGDPVLDEAADRLASEAGPPLDRTGVLPAVVSTRYRTNGIVLSLISTIAQFGSAEDIALADLKIEFLFPADDATRDILLANKS